MDAIISTIITVFERERVLTFLDQFDQFIFDSTVDVKSLVFTKANEMANENIFAYFSQDIENHDTEALFIKSKELRLELELLKSIVLTVPQVLSSDFIHTISTWITSNTSKQVLLDFKIDAAIIAGAIVESGGFVEERSMRSYFEERKEIRRRSYGLS